MAIFWMKMQQQTTQSWLCLVGVALFCMVPTWVLSWREEKDFAYTLYLTVFDIIFYILPTDVSQVHQRGRDPAKVQACIGLPQRKDFDSTGLGQYSSFSFPKLEIGYHLGLSIVWVGFVSLPNVWNLWELLGACPWPRASCTILMARVDNDFLIWRNTPFRACFVIL